MHHKTFLFVVVKIWSEIWSLQIGEGCNQVSYFKCVHARLQLPGIEFGLIFSKAVAHFRRGGLCTQLQQDMFVGWPHDMLVDDGGIIGGIIGGIDDGMISGGMIDGVKIICD